MKISKIAVNPFRNENNHINKTVKNAPQVFKGTGVNVQNLYPQGINYWIDIHRPVIDSLENIETVTLKNNVVLNIDKNSPDSKIAFELHAKPVEKKEVNPAVKAVYAQMMDYSKIENGNDTGTSLWNGECLESASLWDKNGFPEILKETLKQAYNPDLSEERFNYEKSLMIYDFDSMQEDSLYKHIYDFKPYTKEDVEKVTLEDVKKLHNDMKSNYMTTCSISIPKGTDETAINQIKDIMENGIPNQKPFDIKFLSKQILPIEENKTIRSKNAIGNSKTVQRYYTVKDNDTLKDAVTFELTGYILGKIMRANVPKDIKDFGCSCSANYWNKFFGIFTMSEDKNANLEESINSAVNEIVEKPLDNKSFEEAKEELLAKRKDSLKESRNRARIMSELYTDGSYSLKDYSEALNSLTPEIIHKKAQEYFNKPFITEISE